LSQNQHLSKGESTDFDFQQQVSSIHWKWNSAEGAATGSDHSPLLSNVIDHQVELNARVFGEEKSDKLTTFGHVR